MKWAWRVSLALLALAGGAGGAQAQTADERINAGLARARETGIPMALLQSKIAEGKAKGVSLERIAAAVERRLLALEHASQALEGQRNVVAADLSVAADAIESGVSKAVLQTLAATTPRERRVVAIAVIGQLVQAGHASDVALDRVRAALGRGPDALSALASEAARGNGRGNGPPAVSPAGGADAPGLAKQTGPPREMPAPGRAGQATGPASGQGTDRNPGRGKP